MSDISNPYQSPSSRLLDPGSSEFVPAERWRRFVNVLVDYLGFIVLTFVVFLVIGLVGGRDLILRIQQIPGFFLGAPLMFIYYVVQESLFGRTLGKLVTGTRVINEKGGEPDLAQVTGRTLARFIPFEAFSIFRESALGWHDTLSHTRVVRKR